ncbi:MAG: DUF6554 family protein [Synechococcus sp.]
MARNRIRSLLRLSLASLCLSSLLPLSGHAADTAPHKGAQVYCFMRDNGNVHNVSWEAAYALIKRQKAGVFKTSPEHAAVMITEAVVNDPDRYPNCGRYLGDLFAPKTRDSSTTTDPDNGPASSTTQSSPSSSQSYGEKRYSY